MSKVDAGQTLTDDERQLHESHPQVAERLLAAIPRLEDVAVIVTAQFGALSFAGRPENLLEWDDRSIGQLLLRTAFEFDRLILKGTTRSTAVATLGASKLGLPVSVMQRLRSLVPANRERVHDIQRIGDVIHLDLRVAEALDFQVHAGRRRGLQPV